MNNMKSVIHSNQEKIIDDFSEFDDWFDIYNYLISKGKSFDPNDNAIRNDKYSIGGCQSSVWIKAEKKRKSIHYTADSDSLIIKGIISLLLDVINDQEPSEIINADLYFLDEIGLHSNLSPSRTNGLNSIIHEIKEKAKLLSTD